MDDSRRSSAEELLVDVIIIGGGASGIHAAACCIQSGKSILLLESRDRLGGRIHSQQLSSSGTYVECGAQWLAKKGQNRLDDIAKRFNYTKLRHVDGKCVVWNESGERSIYSSLSYGQSFFTLLGALWHSWKLSKLSKYISIDGPFDPKMKTYDTMSMKTYLESHGRNNRKKKANTLLSKIIKGGFNRDPSDISVYNYARVLRCSAPISEISGAEEYYFDEGLQPLFEKYASSFQDRIRLNSHISKIDTSDDCFIRVGTSTNVWYEGKQVIIAMPPQLLQYIEFEPQLPLSLRELSSSSLQGQVVKLVAVFPSPWWRKYGYSGFVISHDDVISEVADLSHSTGNGVLAGFISGPEALVYCDKPKSELTQIFSDLIKKSFEQMDEEIQELFYHNWIRDECSLGGYASHVAIGKWQTLLQGSFFPSISNSRVHFAGTEYAHEWRGYIEGALESGERTAKAVLSNLDGD